jgi:integrase
MLKNEDKNNDKMEEFLDYLKNRKYSKSTISNYFFGVKSFLDYLELNNIDIANTSNQKIIDFKEYLINQGNSNQTINSKLYSVIKYFDYLKNCGRANILISVDFFKNKNKKDIANISQFEFEQIIQHIHNSSNKDILLKTRDELIFKLIYYTGIRTKDLLRLKRNDFDGQILNAVNHPIHVNKDVIKLLKFYLSILPANENCFLCFSFGAKKYNFSSCLTEKSIEEFFRKYSAILGRSLSIRDMRHSNFSNLITMPISFEIDKIHNRKYITLNGEFLHYFLKG